ncbi:MAG: hypothetical protein IBJ12_08020 [Sphingomonadaceae bacterium]|nr:hypothetical protein [Sphingomonadaceae bacterium]
MTPSNPLFAGYDWSDPAHYAYLLKLGRPGLMWEWLRRDPGYQAIAPVEPPEPATGPHGYNLLIPAPRAAVDRWGLHFRGIGQRCRR